VCFAVSSLLTSTHLQDEATAAVSFYGFACVLLTGWATFLVDPHPWSFGLAQALLLGGVAISFQAFQGLRNQAFQLSRSPAVVSMLYVEIVFAFVWGGLFLSLFSWNSLVGALVLVGSSIAQLEHRRRADEALARAIAEGGGGEGVAGSEAPLRLTGPRSTASGSEAVAGELLVPRSVPPTAKLIDRSWGLSPSCRGLDGELLSARTSLGKSTESSVSSWRKVSARPRRSSSEVHSPPETWPCESAGGSQGQGTPPDKEMT